MPVLLYLSRGVLEVLLALEQDASLLQSVTSTDFETLGERKGIMAF